MQERSPALQCFLDALHAAVRAGASPASPARQAAKKIFDALKLPALPCAREAIRLPAAVHLDDALNTARRAAGAVAKVADAFAELEPSLTWHRRPGAENADPAFADGHSNATIVGATGIERRGDVWVGVSLMAPGVRYPDHRHPPEEVYVVLSPGEWRQADGPWFEPGIGAIVYNPPNILHAMRSDTAPLFAAWCLWLGERQGF